MAAEFDPMHPEVETGSERRLEGLIVGGGISGLALGHWLRIGESAEAWELWEGTGRVGGTMGTDRADGYSVDWGPNGFLDREPLTRKLVEEVGLTDVLEPADDSSEKRFIVKQGRLHPVPISPGAVLATGLLSRREKMRMFLEPFVRARRDDADESVFDFAARRIGRGAAESFIDPMVSGIFGGLARELSLPACFPVMREMELRYGGLVRAMIARRFARRSAERTATEKHSGGPAGPGGRLTSFRSGLDVLITRLAERMSGAIKVNSAVTRIERIGSNWAVTDGGGRRAFARHVICACPAFSAAEIFSRSDPDLAAALGAIPYAPIVVVATGHRRQDVGHPLDGFGFLIPRSEGMRTLGSIWTSSIFAARAPSGHVQFRSMLGGAGDPGALDLSDAELWTTLQRELGPLVEIRKDPAFMRVYRWRRGIPQYTLGHIQRRARLEELARQRPGLYFVGNAFYGVGLNDCVKMAYNLAQQIRSRMENRTAYEETDPCR